MVSPARPHLVKMSSLVERRLTRAEFQGLAEMPAEVEWFQNLDSLNTSASYQVDLRNFMKFLGIEQAEEDSLPKYQPRRRAFIASGESFPRSVFARSSR